MGAIYRGTSLVPISQTIIDWGQGDYDHGPETGSAWRWTGRMVRLEPAREDWLQGISQGQVMAAAGVSAVRHGGWTAEGRTAAPEADGVVAAEVAEPPYARVFHVSDGRRRYPVAVLSGLCEGPDLLAFDGDIPPRDTDLVVVASYAGEIAAPRAEPVASGQVCFTPGTLILTPAGPRPVETLEPGDRVVTRDSGVQRIYWIGQRRLGGARLAAMPHLRPVRIRAGSLGGGLPESDLWVSPDHRLLLRGAAVDAMLGTPEVLAAARDLVDERGIVTETRMRETTYIHLLFEHHEIVWANGVEAETFHPADCDLSVLDAAQRQSLTDLFPEVLEEAGGYGPHARRILRRAEAAILAQEQLGMGSARGRA
ncbi:MAG: Hint domain-containing protein [Rhodobacteraceae bacterium]|nr:Hint domain-containing protein [Paracoccaceae bacterium]